MPQYIQQKIITHNDITKLGSNSFVVYVHVHAVRIMLPLFTESSIPRFMEHYRTSFPHASIIPKMHLLEDHVLPWVKHGRVGSGLMGEQGAEQIHAHIHHLERAAMMKRLRMKARVS